MIVSNTNAVIAKMRNAATGSGARNASTNSGTKMPPYAAAPSRYALGRATK